MKYFLTGLSSAQNLRFYQERLATSFRNAFWVAFAVQQLLHLCKLETEMALFRPILDFLKSNMYNFWIQEAT